MLEIWNENILFHVKNLIYIYAVIQYFKREQLFSKMHLKFLKWKCQLKSTTYFQILF